VDFLTIIKGGIPEGDYEIIKISLVIGEPVLSPSFDNFNEDMPEKDEASQSNKVDQTLSTDEVSSGDHPSDPEKVIHSRKEKSSTSRSVSHGF